MDGPVIPAADWTDLGHRLGKIMAAMLHDEHSDLCGSEFTGEALRRMWDQISHGYITREEAGRLVDANRSVDRANGERAETQLAVERAKFAATMTEGARCYAQAIRARAASVPSHYRREGALLAADWIAPGT